MSYRCRKAGRPDDPLLAGQCAIHLQHSNVVLKEAQSRWVAVVVPEDGGVVGQPLKVLVADHLGHLEAHLVRVHRTILISGNLSCATCNLNMFRSCLSDETVGRSCNNDLWLTIGEKKI